jgi:poly-beta-1,6-N-acetyl-D-glucosamine synthase
MFNKKLFFYIALYLITAAMIASIFIFEGTPREVTWISNIVIFVSFVFLTKYLIYMLISPWYDARWALWKNRNHKLIEGYRPKVSVIVPAWNEEVGIISTIRSLINNTYDNLEIVVINDGSTDNSDDLIKDYANSTISHGKTIIYEYKENAGKGSALNRGIELASGDIIVTIDADSIADKYAIQKFVEHFADPTIMAAVGNVKIGNTDSLISTVQYLEFLFSFYFKRADSVLGSIYIIGGAAGAFRREVFEKLGPYSQVNITEDIELSVRIQNAGMKIVYAAESVVYTEGASDMRSLMNQRLRWKRGRFDTFIRYNKLFFSTHGKHNKVLSWFVLPFAVIGDTQLLFELPFIIFLYVTAFITRDFSAFAAALIIVTFVFFVQVFARDNKYNKSNVYILAPVGWLMFYLITIVEINALAKSLSSLYRNKAVEWQSWKRTGLTDYK